MSGGSCRAPRSSEHPGSRLHCASEPLACSRYRGSAASGSCRSEDAGSTPLPDSQAATTPAWRSSPWGDNDIRGAGTAQQRGSHERFEHRLRVRRRPADRPRAGSLHSRRDLPLERPSQPRRARRSAISASLRCVTSLSAPTTLATRPSTPRTPMPRSMTQRYAPPAAAIRYSCSSVGARPFKWSTIAAW
jgi:hypothetical protein